MNFAHIVPAAIWLQFGRDLSENLKNRLIESPSKGSRTASTEKGDKKMKPLHEHTLDLTSQEGNGDFLCPQCRATISPDDKTEDTYSIIETKVDGLYLKELVIRCNQCKSLIHLTGFSLLQELPKMEKPGLREGTEVCFVAHV